MLVGDDGTVPKERYVSRAFLDLEMERLWPRVWQVACREEEVAEVGDYVDYVIGDQSILVGARHHQGLLQPLPAPRHAPGRGLRIVRRRHDPLPLPRLVLRPRGPRHRHPRRPRVPRDALRPPARRGARRVLGRLRVRQHGQRRRAPPRVPRPAAVAAGALPRRPDAVPVVPQHRSPGQLEGGRRRLQRELPRAGNASADPAVDRRRRDRVRAVRGPLALRPAAERAPAAAAEPAARAGRR